MQNKGTQNQEFIHLDFIRGFAALAVMAGHLRAYTFVTPDRLEQPGIAAKVFYFLTGFGHESVIIFFALSGFFITKSITSLIERDAWSWRYYLVHRVSRLWTVLLPALLLTLCFDFWGQAASDGKFYTGEYFQQYARGPGGESGGIDLSVRTLFGNVFFLQTIYTPTYGTNYPLWSLAYEFWYYILFPLAFVPFATKASVTYKVLSLCVFFLIVIWLPLHILQLGLVWLFGSVTYLAYKKEAFKTIIEKWWVIGVTVAVAIAVISAVRVGLISHSPAKDYLVGIATCGVLATIPRFTVTNRLYEGVSLLLSKISYTLYAIHDPILAFCASVLLANTQGQFDTATLAKYFGLFAMTILISYVVYWLFERNTHLVTSRMMKNIKRFTF